MNRREDFSQQQSVTDNSKANCSMGWKYRRDEYLLALLSSVPTGVGNKLRQLAYPLVFERFGKNVTIEFSVRFIRPKSMVIGNSCSICNYSFLNCWEDGGELVLEDSVRLDQGFHLQALGGKVRIGQNTYLGPYVCMAGPGDITIGKNCLIASNTGLYANNHIFSGVDIPINQQGLTAKGIEIEEDCWLGSGAKVVDGVTIGRGSVIGAGSVVTKDIPPYSIAVGAPAKVIRQRTLSEVK
ncbi:acyltransferase [Leptolyngbya sp. CCNP1308]|uniref:acyltransferase n=1 Tax=Leptolyngbya sp. CCNP1308 TaxID=3110255 RepID=UPI002B1F35AE|nr:acyltransferase [Leptolyngbya sp. CCNP1308]MEA5448371.1 acyltransferase [Leptolyngbya sp. CCNP1308]